MLFDYAGKLLFILIYQICYALHVVAVELQDCNLTVTRGGGCLKDWVLKSLSESFWFPLIILRAQSC